MEISYDQLYYELHFSIAQLTYSCSVRVETGVEEGDTVSMHYDPMIAKLVVWGESRTAALVKLKNCLSNFQVQSVHQNQYISFDVLSVYIFSLL
jgi:acetyl/propionyl-CoA carboxylase alpha subunit